MRKLHCVNCDTIVHEYGQLAGKHFIDALIETYDEGAQSAFLEALSDTPDVRTVDVKARPDQVDADCDLVYCPRCVVKLVSFALGQIECTAV